MIYRCGTQNMLTVGVRGENAEQEKGNMLLNKELENQHLFLFF